MQNAEVYPQLWSQGKASRISRISRSSVCPPFWNQSPSAPSRGIRGHSAAPFVSFVSFCDFESRKSPIGDLCVLCGFPELPGSGINASCIRLFSVVRGSFPPGFGIKAQPLGDLRVLCGWSGPAAAPCLLNRLLEGLTPQNSIMLPLARRPKLLRGHVRLKQRAPVLQEIFLAGFGHLVPVARENV